MKKYVRPETEIIELIAQSTLLAGSGGVNDEEQELDFTELEEDEGINYGWAY